MWRPTRHLSRSLVLSSFGHGRSPAARRLSSLPLCSLSSPPLVTQAQRPLSLMSATRGADVISGGHGS
jgi:hypothetical protein